MTNLKLLIISLTLFGYSLLVQATSNEYLSGIASYYGKQHHGKLMANGKPFNMHKVSFAHKKYPLGTTLEVCYKTCVVGKVTDRGPYISGRVLDLSQAAAIKIGLFTKGVDKVTYKIYNPRNKFKLNMTTEELNTLVSVGNTILKNMPKLTDAVNWSDLRCIQARQWNDNDGDSGIQLIFSEASPDAYKFKEYVSTEFKKLNYIGIEIITEW